MPEYESDQNVTWSLFGPAETLEAVTMARDPEAGTETSSDDFKAAAVPNTQAGVVALNSSPRTPARIRSRTEAVGADLADAVVRPDFSTHQPAPNVVLVKRGPHHQPEAYVVPAGHDPLAASADYGNYWLYAPERDAPVPQVAGDENHQAAGDIAPVPDPTDPNGRTRAGKVHRT